MAFGMCTTAVRRMYYPYGEEITGTANDTFKYAQLFRDSDSGLDYAEQRYYSSSIGRFVNVDPYTGSAASTRPQSWNQYSYVEGDPINATDPTGTVLCVPGVTCVTDPQWITCYILTGLPNCTTGTNGVNVPVELGNAAERGAGTKARATAQQTLNKASKAAQADLDKPDCIDFFKGMMSSSGIGGIGIGHQPDVVGALGNLVDSGKVVAGDVDISQGDYATTTGWAAWVKITVYTTFLTGSPGDIAGIRGSDTANNHDTDIWAFTVLHELGHALAREYLPLNPGGWDVFNVRWETDAAKQGLADNCIK